MKLTSTMFILAAMLCLSSTNAYSQGAALSGVREAAENLAGDVQSDQKTDHRWAR